MQFDTLKNIFYCFYKAGENTVNHDGIEHAGYLAFLGLLSLFPFLVFLMAIAGHIGENLTQIQFIEWLILRLPAEVVEVLRPRVHEITSGPSQGLLTVAIVGALWTSSSAVEGMRTVLNRAYRVHTPPSYLWRRLVSIAQIIFLTFVIIIGMALLVIWPIVWQYLQTLTNMQLDEIEAGTGGFGYTSYVIGGLLLFFVASSLYYVLPNIRQSWLSVVPGAAVAAIGWLIAARLFSLYLANFDQVNIIYGSLGGIIVTLLFFYMLGIIFIYGAEFGYLLKKFAGERIEEKEEVPPSQIRADEKGL